MWLQETCSPSYMARDRGTPQQCLESSNTYGQGDACCHRNNWPERCRDSKYASVLSSKLESRITYFAHIAVMERKETRQHTRITVLMCSLVSNNFHSLILTLYLYPRYQLIDTSQVWLCKTCGVERQMWMKTGAWFFKVKNGNNN